MAELPENWTDTRETILEGVTFSLRHLGMTLVDQPKGEEQSATAVKRIVATVGAAFFFFLFLSSISAAELRDLKSVQSDFLPDYRRDMVTGPTVVFPGLLSAVVTSAAAPTVYACSFLWGFYHFCCRVELVTVTRADLCCLLVC